MPPVSYMWSASSIWKMGVHMQLVYDELIKPWNEGVLTYDRATKKNFGMHVWYQYSMHDFLPYGIFAGRCVQGKFPCPVCKATLEFIWLKKGDKFVRLQTRPMLAPGSDVRALAVPFSTKEVFVKFQGALHQCMECR
jgi:hypothetical protein